MPTGYTSDLYDLNDVSFADFAFTCSRAWGARVMERDNDWSSAYVPRTVGDYETKALSDAVAKLDEALNRSEQDWLDAFEEDTQEVLDANAEALAISRKRKAKYQDMLDQVNAWEPPTKDHVAFKTFMIEQVEGSIEFDCNERIWRPAILDQTIERYKIDTLQNINQDIDSSIKRLAEEIERVRTSNKWVQDLVDSI